MYASTNLPLSPGGRAVYVSLDAGLTWSPYDRGLPTDDNDNGSSLAVASDGSVLHLAGFGSVFEIRASSTPPPSLTAISPTSGAVAGGTLALLEGNGFASITSVKFGPTAASFLVVDDAHVAAIAPPASSGVVAVTVTTDEPQDDTLARAFVYD